MSLRQGFILYLLLHIVLCSSLFAQVVDVPDPNLRAAIREELQLRPNSEITKEDMLRLEGLGAARREIMHLTGLEHATNLTSLSLWGNPLSELAPIANLQSLTYLDVAACSISDITSLSNLVNLTGLNVRFNRIVDISPVKNLTNLVTLRLEGNRISRCYATRKSHTTHRIVPERQPHPGYSPACTSSRIGDVRYSR